MAGLSLSKREGEVVDLLLQAKSNKQISQILHISESTVEYHLQHIYAKLEVESRAEAIVKLGKTPIPPPEERPGISTVANGDGSGDDEENPVQVVQMNQNKPPSQFSIPVLISIGAVLVAIIALTVSSLSGFRVLPIEVTRVVLAEVAHTVEVTRVVKVAQRVEVTRQVVVTRKVEVTRLVPAPVIYPGTGLREARDYPAAARMADGRILVAGGSHDGQFLASAEIFDPATGQIISAASMHTPRHESTATALSDGRVLIVGGYNTTSSWLGDAELYDPVRDDWTVVPPLSSHGVQHTATLLPDGRVLVMGGATGSGLCTSTTEIFDPASLTWHEMTPMPEPRGSHSTTVLSNGRVLIAGGDTCHGSPAQDALLFSPQANTWRVTGPMVSPVRNHQAVTLQDGRVLVVGGLLNQATPNTTSTTTTQLYNPISNAWSTGKPAAQPRYNFALVVLTDGRVVMAGGSRDYDNVWTDASFVSEVELYNPKTASWQTIGNLPEPRAELAAVLLPGDKIWLAGGRTASVFWSSTWLIEAGNYRAQ